MNLKLARNNRRSKRTRKHISNDLPRLSVYRSLKHISAQIIDDAQGITIVAASDKELTKKDLKGIQKAAEVGKIIAQKAISKKINTIVFDKGSYKYHGRVKALADAAREAGLKF